MTFGKCVMPVQKDHMHMDVPLSHDKDMKNDFVKQRINKARRTFFAAESIGSRAY